MLSKKSLNGMLEETNVRLATVITERIPVSESQKNSLFLAQKKTEFSELMKDSTEQQQDNTEHVNF
jgi:hypothetical protein